MAKGTICCIFFLLISMQNPFGNLYANELFEVLEESFLQSKRVIGLQNGYACLEFAPSGRRIKKVTPKGGMECIEGPVIYEVKQKLNLSLWEKNVRNALSDNYLIIAIDQNKVMYRLREFKREQFMWAKLSSSQAQGLLRKHNKDNKSLSDLLIQQSKCLVCMLHLSMSDSSRTQGAIDDFFLSWSPQIHFSQNLGIQMRLGFQDNFEQKQSVHMRYNHQSLFLTLGQGTLMEKDEYLNFSALGVYKTLALRHWLFTRDILFSSFGFEYEKYQDNHRLAFNIFFSFDPQ